MGMMCLRPHTMGDPHTAGFGLREVFNMKRFKALVASVAVIAGAQFFGSVAQAATLVTCVKATCSYSAATQTGSGASTALAKGTKAKPTTATSSFSIVLPSAGTFEISVTPSGNGPSGTGLSFTSLVFNGVTIANPAQGFIYSFAVAKAGTYDFAVSASNNANKAIAFSTSYSFAGVPEPATWGLMIAGVGMAGGSLRRRRSTRIAIA